MGLAPLSLISFVGVRRAGPGGDQRHRRRLPLRRRRILPPGDAEAALRGRQAGSRGILTVTGVEEPILIA